ncbi:hypothetical protein BJF88_12785 [Cellulosimicrobium sp. CUA-896]|nr:hypothetical protein BJF88_12785 [Cellulosimicrobium sp. CUA-896]
MFDPPGTSNGERPASSVYVDLLAGTDENDVARCRARGRCRDDAQNDVNPVLGGGRDGPA